MCVHIFFLEIIVISQIKKYINKEKIIEREL